jgi:lipoyl(octanoyl) transferase
MNTSIISSDLSHKICIAKKYGIVPYSQALEIQKQLVEKIQNGEANDTLLLLEHNPVITIGKNGNEDNLLVNKESLQKSGIEIARIDRGGDITIHSPGQLIGYPIINLQRYKSSVKWYVNRIEELLIRTLAHYEISANRMDGLTGVWVGQNKISAIGTRISRWVTSHGFALNVNNNLDYFNLIIPCGIKDKGITSISKILGKDMDIEDVKNIVIKEFGKVFECDVSNNT